MNVKNSVRALLPAAALLVATSASVVSAQTPTYEARLREWTSAGYRVQPGAVYLFSLQRTDSRFPNLNAEVAGVQAGPDAALVAEPPSYEAQLRRFSPSGYRIQPGFVNTSAIARR
ncbi:MAG TPA: hypothetical protein VFX49_03570 [Chloroflexota bacterium]|nr:hypothetical protein [Chloroflexota bacterium]